MIAVSEDFKTAMKQPARQLKAYLLFEGSYIRESDDLQYLKISISGELCKTVMRQAEAMYFDTHNFLDEYINIGVGVVLPDTTTEYIDYGSFKVISQETNEGTEGTKIKMFDKMYEALQQYDLEPIYDVVYPATLLELLQAICLRLDWTLLTTTFPNSTLEIASDLFLDQQLSFRDVLDQIAEASGSIIYFNNEDELVVRQPSATSLETLDKNTLQKLKVESRYGPITSIVLSRQPQEDNIAKDSP